jgi:alkylation response protein AidB-like acyl-CoA dehydrogenase
MYAEAWLAGGGAAVDLELTPKEQEFRDELRVWLDEHLVGEFAEHRGIGGPASDEGWDIRVRWDKELSAAGWLGLTWPRELGGRGLTPREEAIFVIEHSRANAPYLATEQGLTLLGPTLLAFGTEAQKRRFIPPILAVDELWGQGFSEPGAGSDLASVATRAERDGDTWVINGQKIWTSAGDRAQWLYVLCRTAPDPALRHRGLTMFIVDARQPGVEIRPITNMAGRGEFSEMFFADARTPGDLMLGELNGGWRVAMGTLSFERGLTLLSHQIRYEREIGAAIELARDRGLTGDPVTRQRLASAWAAVQVMRFMNLRSLTALFKAEEPGSFPSITKVFASRHHQRLTELHAELAGPWLEVVGEGYELKPVQSAFLGSRAETIYGGTAEIQHNIIAERVLGLPR